MAELLIKASDTTNPNPVKDLRGCYKKGDVVVRKPNGWKWGKEELKKEKFYILRVLDKTVEETQCLTQPDEITIGTRYVAEAPEIGVRVDAADEASATKACQEQAAIAIARLQKYVITPAYIITTIGLEIKHTIARRKVKVDIESIEKDLQSGIVELTSDKVSLIDKAEGTKITLSEIAAK